MKTIFKYFEGDKTIWLIILVLTVVSLLAVYSATGTLAYKYHHGDTSHYLFRHSTLLLVGFVVLFAVHKVNYIWYKRISKVLIWITLPLLLFTLKGGASLNEASRWIVLPGTGLSFQTSDLAKFSLIIFIARHLTDNQDNIKDFKTGFRPIFLWIIAIVVLIFPANFSTAAMLFLISMTMLFVGRVRTLYIGGVFAAGILFLALSYGTVKYVYPDAQNIARVETWVNRIDRFLGVGVEEGEENEGNFQAEQSQIAIVKGGFLGKGPGNSEQRNFLPHPYSDFIFSIIIEEYGIWGAFVIIAMFLLLFHRIGQIVNKSTSSFGSYLAIGIGLSLTIQAFINMGVAVGIFPVTGQTLPLVSMGGTSILFTSASLGMLLSISKFTVAKEKNKNKI